MYSVILNIEGQEQQRLLVNPTINSLPVTEENGEDKTPPSVLNFLQLPIHCHIAGPGSNEASATAFKYDMLTNTMVPVFEHSAYDTSDARRAIVPVSQRSSYKARAKATTMAMPHSSSYNPIAANSRMVPGPQHSTYKANVTTTTRVPMPRYAAYNASNIMSPMEPMPQRQAYNVSNITSPMEPIPRHQAYNASVVTSNNYHFMTHDYSCLQVENDSRPISKSNMALLERNWPASLEISPIPTDEEYVLPN